MSVYVLLHARGGGKQVVRFCYLMRKISMKRVVANHHDHAAHRSSSQLGAAMASQSCNSSQLVTEKPSRWHAASEAIPPSTLCRCRWGQVNVIKEVCTTVDKRHSNVRRSRGGYFNHVFVTFYVVELDRGETDGFPHAMQEVSWYVQFFTQICHVNTRDPNGQTRHHFTASIWVISEEIIAPITRSNAIGHTIYTIRYKYDIYIWNLKLDSVH